MSAELVNKAAPGAPFFTPAQDPPAGTALNPDSAPTLFRPLQIRGLQLQNRFVVSPMCQYSADDGHLTDWHFAHLAGFAMRGAALTIVEATAVTANGRISPEDSGLWKDSQKAPLRRIVDFAHSQGQKIGIQLAHAGRKASTVAPWLAPSSAVVHGSSRGKGVAARPATCPRHASAVATQGRSRAHPPELAPQRRLQLRSLHSSQRP